MSSIISCINPKQPFFVLANDSYYKVVVMKYGISHFYSYVCDKKYDHGMTVVPDGSVDLLFCCDKEHPEGNVCGTVLAPKRIINKVGYRYFGVRFMPGHTPFLGQASMSDVIDEEIAFEDIYRNEREIFEKITSSDNFEYQIQVFMEFYLKRWQSKQLGDKDNLKHDIISYILHSGGNVPIKELAEEFCYSERYINNLVKDATGLSPKLFCRMMRFQYVLDNISDNSLDTELIEVAAEAGYYDQSHMMKDFKAFASITPGKYVHSRIENSYDDRLIILK